MTDSNAYKSQLNTKTNRFKTLFADLYPHQIDIYPSPESGFRMRAEFRFWHDGDDAYFIMYEKGDKTQFYRVDEFAIAHPSINRMMQVIRKEILANAILRKKLFMVEFLATLSGQMLITLAYHRPLADDWVDAAKQLENKHNIRIIGRSRKQRLVISETYVDETLTVAGKTLHYRQIEGGFTQPNAAINTQMLTWAQQNVNTMTCKDLLELYCGNGNFTIALAPLFKQVLATEISKPSVTAAKHNLAVNKVNNTKICRMSSEDLTAALNKVREFNRLKEAQVNLDNYDFSHVFVDPPRAGLDPDTLQLISRFDHIIYISCNPDTLLANLITLSNTHSVEKMALFDQFPYTDHIESGVILSRKQ